MYYCLLIESMVDNQLNTDSFIFENESRLIQAVKAISIYIKSGQFVFLEEGNDYRLYLDIYTNTNVKIVIKYLK